ncbi:MAG TPA: hypothetical protein VNR42_05780 [Solirubrobacteraceae bacterium]|nr:hypothetical protein [Solirubrobacteraceae bacterium]
MDPIHPIAPGPPLIPRGSLLPVERLERISRERDRPTREERRQRRDPAYRRAHDPAEDEASEDDDGRPHIDVRV